MDKGWSKRIPEDALRDAIMACDGHGIFRPEMFLEMGVPQDIVDHFTAKHTSDTSSHKSTIFDNKTGQPKDSETGIYGLTFAEAVANDMDVKLRHDIMGRGFRYGVAADGIMKKLKPPSDNGGSDGDRLKDTVDKAHV